MLKIIIEKLSRSEVEDFGIDGWNTWECEPSTFDWRYETDESAYVLEGKVKVKTPWEEVQIEKGDFVTFPGGLSCTWTVIEPIKKVFTFNLSRP